MKVFKWLKGIGLFLSQPYPFYYKGKSLALIAGFLFFCTGPKSDPFLQRQNHR